MQVRQVQRGFETGATGENMNGSDLEQIKEIMVLHVGYIQKSLDKHGVILDDIRTEQTDTKVEIAKLQAVGVRRATWVSAAVSGVITSVANVLMWRWRV